MRAYVVSSHESPPDLIETDAPTPAPGQVQIGVRACALNFADLLMLKGTYQETPPLPFVPGLEVAGTVTALGEGVAHLAVGDRVAAFAGQGGLAETLVVDAARCVPLPETMDFDTGAAFQVAYGTSHLALSRRARLSPGETLVVTGAAGGVGLTAVELGAAMGARVIGIARGTDKAEIARAAGAAEVLDAEAPDLKDQLKALGGIDVAYDAVGGALFEACFRAAKPEARLLVIGFASGDIPTLKPNHMLVKNVDVIGFYWGGYLPFAPEALTGSLKTLIEWHAQGRLRPHIGARFPLSEAAAALDLLRTRRSTGKIVVTVPE